MKWLTKYKSSSKYKDEIKCDPYDLRIVEFYIGSSYSYFSKSYLPRICRFCKQDRRRIQNYLYIRCLELKTSYIPFEYSISSVLFLNKSKNLVKYRHKSIYYRMWLLCSHKWLRRLVQLLQKIYHGTYLSA